MKNITFIIAFLLSALSMQSQILVEGVDINGLEGIKIIRIGITGQVFSKKKIIFIDYGQEVKWGDRKGSIISDRRGDIIKFNSEIAAINWFEQNGWEYLETTTDVSGAGGNTSSYHFYYFRKKE